MKKLFRKIVTMLLAVLMVESFLPTCAEDDAGAAVNPSNEISLSDICNDNDIKVVRTSGGTVTRSSTTLDFSISYTINAGKAGTTEDPGDARTHDVWVYDLTEFLQKYPEFTGLTGNQGGNVTNGQEVTGTYKIEDNKVKITPDQEWLKRQGANKLSGTFNLSFQFDGTKVPEGGNKEYQFPGSSSTTIVTYDDVSVQTTKTVDGVNNGTVKAIKQADGNYRLKYNVWVKTDADMNQMALNDTLTGDQTFDLSSFKVRNNWPMNNDQPVPVSFITATDNQSITFDLSSYLKSLDASVGEGGFKGNKDYFITYETIIPANSIGTEVDNSAHWTYNGTKNSGNTETHLTTKKDLTVKKEVSVSGGNTYTYTITVGDGSESLNGHTITDTMSDNQMLNGAITIQQVLPESGNSTTITPNAAATDDNHSNNDVNLFTYNFPDSGCGTKYQITYMTTASNDTSLYGKQAIRNKTTDNHGNDHGESSTSEEHDFGVDKQNIGIQKDFDKWDADQKKAYWKIALTADNNNLPLHNVDVREEDYHYGYGSNSYGHTPVINWDDAIVKSGETTLTKNTDYKIVTDPNNSTYQYIHFDNYNYANITIELPVTLSDGMTSAEGGANIYNKAGVYINGKWKNSDDATAKYSSGQWSMTKDVSGPDDNGLYTWTVEINPTKETFEPDIVAYFRDELPANMEFAGSDRGTDYIHVDYEGPNYYSASAGFKVQPDSQNVIGPVRLNGVKPDDWWNGTVPAGLSGYKIRVTYKTRTNAAWRKQNNGQPHTFTNKAQVVNSAGTVLKEVQKNVEYTQKYLDKKDTSSERLENGHATIDYQIDVNPDELTLNGGNNCTLTDVIAQNVELMTGTIRVIDPETNQDIPKIAKGVSYDDNTRTLTILVPDSKHVRVQYSVKPTTLSSDGQTSETFTNTATLHASQEWGDEEIKKHVVVNHGATLTGEANSVSLLKVSKYNLKKYLPGAQFTLYKAGLNDDYSLNNNDVQVGQTQTTGDDGKVTFTGLSFGNASNKVLYYWKETKAPEGYAASDNLNTKHYFVLYSDNTTDTATGAQNKAAADALMNAVNEKNRINAREVSGAYEWLVTNTKNAYATAVIRGSKIMKNRSMADREFSFTISGVSGVNSDDNTKITGEDVPLPAVKTISVPETGKIIEKDKKYDFAFGGIRYNYPGTFEYEVRENHNDDSTVNFDNTVYAVKVTVKRNDDGDLYVDGEPEYGIKGQNVYTKPEKADFVNTQKTGEIAVTKTVKGNAGDPDQRFTFIIRMDASTPAVVKNAVYEYQATGNNVVSSEGAVEFNDGTAQFSLASGQTYHLKGIPEGTKYTVEEDSSLAQGYDITVDGKASNESDEKSVTAGNDNVSSTAFVNTKNAYGQLKINKKLTGNALTDDDTNRDYKFTLHVDGNDDLSHAKIGETALPFGDSRNATVTVKGNQSVTVTGLPLNAEYTLTETEDSRNGFSSTSYQYEGKISSDNASGKIYDNSEVNVINTKNLYGGISLTKKTAGNDPDKKHWFAFKINLDSVPSDATYRYQYDYVENGESKTKTGKMHFVNGVSEKLSEAIGVIKNDDYNGKKTDGKTLKVPENYNVINSNGTLYILGIPGDVKYSIQEDDYSETYTDVKYEHESGTVQKLAGKLSESDVKAEDIPADNKAVVTNTRDAFGAIRITKELEGNAGKQAEARGDSFTVDLKMWDTKEQLVKGNHFGFVFDDTGIAKLTLSPSNKYSIKSTKTIPIGYKYQVTEEDTSKGDYDVNEVVRYINNGKMKGEEVPSDKRDIVEVNQHNITITNTRYAWGGFTVEKKVNGTVDSDKSFNFDIRLNENISGEYGYYNDDKNKKISFTDGIALISLKANEKAFIYGLSDGTHYTVTETSTDDGYTPVLKTVEGNVKAVKFSSQDVSDKQIYQNDNFHPENTADQILQNLSDDNKAVIINVHQTGSLILTKSLAGNDQSYKGPFTFIITLKDSAGNPINNTTLGTDEKGQRTVEINLDKPETSSFTLSGLASGTQFTVEETGDVLKNHDYSPSYSVNGQEQNEDGNGKLYASGTITGNQNAIVSVVNTNTSNGNLSVTKDIQGNAADKDKAWNFRLLLDNTSIASAKYDLTDSNNSENNTADQNLVFQQQASQFDEQHNDMYYATFSLKAGQTITVKDLPAGTRYLVSEDDENKNDYYTVKSGETGRIKAKDTVAASFTNTRSATYNLTLKKNVIGNANENKTFKFKVRLNPYDKSVVNGVFDGVTFTDNESSEIGLKAGEYKTITGLPNGTYSVEELSDSSEGYSTTVNRYSVDNDGIITEIQGESSGQFDRYDMIPDSTAASDAGKEKQLNESTEQTVEFTNEKWVYGKLTVAKTVNGTNADNKAKFPFKVKLTGDYGKSFSSVDGVDVSGGYASATATTTIGKLKFTPDSKGEESDSETFYLGNNDCIEINGLPSGAHYEVVEQDQNYADNVYTQTVKSGLVGIIADNTNASVTNTLLSDGELTLKKEVTGTATKKDGVFAFDLTAKINNQALTGDFGNLHFDNNGATSVNVTTDDSGNGDVKLTGLPIGTKIHIQERNYSSEGYDAPVYKIGNDQQSETTDDGIDVMITSASRAEPITVTTVNQKNLPSLRIKKSFEGLNTKDIPSDIRFRITDENGNSFVEDYSKFTDAEKTDGKVIHDLPYGIYTVSEEGGSVEHYKLTTTYKVDESNTAVVDLRKEMTFGKDNPVSERTIGITNTYVREGDLKIQKNVQVNGKSVADDSVNYNLADGTYHFDILDSNGVFTGKTADIKIEKGRSNTAVVKDLVPGTYYVQENLSKSSGKHINQMEPKAMKQVTVRAGETFNASDNKDPSTEITNNLVMNGSLKITKKITVNEKTPKDDKYKGIYHFLVESEKKDEYDNPIYAKPVDINVKDGNSDSITLDDLKPGKYTVREILSDDDKKLPVTITYDQKTVTVEPEQTAETTITNDYSTLSISPEIKKFVNGAAEKHVYKFDIAAITENAPMPSEKTTEVELSGNETEASKFGDIEFTEAGTYQYKITEIPQDYSGIKNSSETVIATINVTNQNGKLVSDGFSYEGGTGEKKNTITNTYTSTPVTDHLSVTKNVSDLIDAQWPQEGFKFRLSEGAGNPKGGAQLSSVETTATVDQKTADFGDITFSKEGLYHFSIQEEIPSDAVNNVKNGIVYSDALHTAEVNVTDNGKGKLVVKSVKYDNSKDSLTVTNAYAPAVSWKPAAFKTIDGNKPDTSFTFALSAVNDNAKKKLHSIITASNDLDGNILFDPIGFNLEDAGKEFDFQMKETSENGNGILVDKSVHTIKVNVTDKGNNTLNVIPSYENEDEIVFNNHAVGDLKIEKHVVSSLKDDLKKEFSFHVQLSDQNINGKFGDLTFEKGNADVKLHDGESVTAEKLPAGINYQVTEKKAEGFSAVSTGETGTITRNTVSNAVFTNTRDHGKLTFSKVIKGNISFDALKNISFTVTGPEGFKEKTYKLSDMKNPDGSYRKTLNITKFGDYKVTEKNAEIPGYDVDVTYTVNNQTSDKVTSVKVNKDTETQILITDTYTEKTGGISLTKKVTGSGDRNREFHFTVKLNDQKINGTYGDMEFKDGIAETVLKDGQTVKAEKLPAGTKYEVTEKEANQDGYVTSSENASGEIKEDQNISVLFTNDKPEGNTTTDNHPTSHDEEKPSSTPLPTPHTEHGGKHSETGSGDHGKSESHEDITPDTSDHTNTTGWASLMIACVVVATITFITRRKYSR